MERVCAVERVETGQRLLHAHVHQKREESVVFTHSFFYTVLQYALAGDQTKNQTGLVVWWLVVRDVDDTCTRKLHFGQTGWGPRLYDMTGFVSQDKGLKTLCDFYDESERSNAEQQIDLCLFNVCVFFVGAILTMNGFDGILVYL